MKREVERKEQEKKRSPKVEFITGVQPPINASIPKIPGIANMKQLLVLFWHIAISCPLPPKGQTVLEAPT
jgi:hypothetical protein